MDMAQDCTAAEDPALHSVMLTENPPCSWICLELLKSWTLLQGCPEQRLCCWREETDPGCRWAGPLCKGKRRHWERGRERAEVKNCWNQGQFKPCRICYSTAEVLTEPCLECMAHPGCWWEAQGHWGFHIPWACVWVGSRSLSGWPQRPHGWKLGTWFPPQADLRGHRSSEPPGHAAQQTQQNNHFGLFFMPCWKREVTCAASSMTVAVSRALGISLGTTKSSLLSTHVTSHWTCR